MFILVQNVEYGLVIFISIFSFYYNFWLDSNLKIFEEFNVYCIFDVRNILEIFNCK